MRLRGRRHNLWLGLKVGSFQAGLTVLIAFQFDRAAADSSRRPVGQFETESKRGKSGWP